MIDPNQVNYSFMQKLEELARAWPKGVEITSMPPEPRSKILVEGKFGKTDFRPVAEEFDNFIRCEGFIDYEGAIVTGGNISVKYMDTKDKNNPVKVVLENSTLEEAERLAMTGNISPQDIWITPTENQPEERQGDYFGKVHLRINGETLLLSSAGVEF
jgi:hypothetical protein